MCRDDSAGAPVRKLNNMKNILAQNHLSLEVPFIFLPCPFHGCSGTDMASPTSALWAQQWWFPSFSWHYIAQISSEPKCSLLFKCLASCSGRISWSQLPKQHNRKNWKEENAWNSRGRITQPPFPPFPWSSFPVSSGGGRKGPALQGEETLSAHCGQGQSWNKMVASQEPFQSIQFLRSTWSEGSHLKSKMDKNVPPQIDVI